MAKFNVGDKVRVRSDLKSGMTFHFWCVMEQMTKHAGKVLTILSIREDSYMVEEDAHHWTDEMFSGLATDQPRREFIVIHQNGNVMTAEHRVNRDVIKSAKATCAPSDTFDFDTGAKLAFDRLMGREEPKPATAPEPPKFYTGKVVCISGEYGVGRIFTVKDGFFADRQYNCPEKPYKSVDDMNDRFLFGKFAEAKE